jgi:hypothetical protein
LETVGALIVKVVVFVEEPSVAVIDSTSAAATGVVVILKVADLAFAAIVTLPGQVMDPSPPDRLTVNPPEPAAFERVTVPVTDVPLITEVGENVRVEISRPFRVTLAVLVVLPIVAEIVSVSLLAIIVEFIVNVAVFAPAATVTVDG